MQNIEFQIIGNSIVVSFEIPCPLTRLQISCETHVAIEQVEAGCISRAGEVTIYKTPWKQTGQYSSNVSSITCPKCGSFFYPTLEEWKQLRTQAVEFMAEVR